MPGGDPATWFPDLWKWSKYMFGVETMLDVGCGEGHAVRFFEEMGVRAKGIDGVPRPQDSIIEHDFIRGPYPNPPKVDLVWSCEFVEHVEEIFLANVMPTLCAGRVLLMTHAFPGQAGFHHVNCQPAEYWKGAIAAYGMWFDQATTNRAREVAAANTDPYNHFVRAGMVFRKPGVVVARLR